MTPPLDVVVLGLSITSSWGNGHATTYRALLTALAGRGHDVLFLERDVPWYAAHRDVPAWPGVDVALYDSMRTLQATWGTRIRNADVVIVGSYVPEGMDVGRWVRCTATGLVAFYDIDTPITLGHLQRDTPCEYIDRQLLRAYDLYLSFAGGRTLDVLAALGAADARPLYCAVDPHAHHPVGEGASLDMGYLGTYAADRQPALDELLLSVAAQQPARRFAVAGPQYPPTIRWPANVERVEHLPPPRHPAFYGSVRFSLNITRADMKALGHAPSVRLFEAAACGAAILTDEWPGLDEFLRPGRDLCVVGSASDVLRALTTMPEDERLAMGEHARTAVLARHTAAVRAQELESYLHERLRTRPATQAAARMPT